MSQTGLSEVLRFHPSSWEQCSLNLPTDICYGTVSVGGLLASLMTRYVTLYASQHPRMQNQPDVWAARVGFHRPVNPARGPITMVLHEVSIGQGWSTMRVDLFQGRDRRIHACCDVMITKFSLPGITAPSPWTLVPAPTQVNLDDLDCHEDPRWICYHTAFHPTGYRRGGSYARVFMPVDSKPHASWSEQWMTPGWDCRPQGSPETRSPDKSARWTNEMIQFAVDMCPQVQTDFLEVRPGCSPPRTSTAAMLRFAKAQKRARDMGDPDWRELTEDGSHEGSHDVVEPVVMASLQMDTEIKSPLPQDGVRWLYLRAEAKALNNGRSDIEVVLFDPNMTLIAISHQVQFAIHSEKKAFREARL